MKRPSIPRGRRRRILKKEAERERRRAESLEHGGDAATIVSATGNVLGAKTTITFRGEGVPLEELDRLQKAASAENRRALSGLIPSVGRNDPCHCGSGRKFKKCCSR